MLEMLDPDKVPFVGKCIVLLSPFIAWATVRILLHFARGGVDLLLYGRQMEHTDETSDASSQADRIWRWLGYAGYLVLLLALGGLYWGAGGLREIGEWSDPDILSGLLLHLTVLLVCLTLWIFYFRCDLLVRWQRKRELREREKFRREQEGEEEDLESPESARRNYFIKKKKRCTSSL